MKIKVIRGDHLRITVSQLTVEGYQEIRKLFDNPEVYDQYREEFFEEYPDCPHPKPIECLDLIMRKEYARQILDGTKTVEIRAYTQHYISRLYDRNVLDYEERHWEDELMRMQMIDFNDSVRAVKKIHFHDYGKTWFLDVECIDNNTVLVNDEQVGFLQKEFGCHEFDDELALLNEKGAEERPMYFYFALGKVLGTDLKLE